MAAKLIAKEFLSAIVKFHARNLLHFDLKPANACIQSVGGVERVNLVDFDAIGVVGRNCQGVCTSGYVAPGYLRLKQYDPLKKESAKFDVYSAGVSLMEMLMCQKLSPQQNSMILSSKSKYQTLKAIQAKYGKDYPLPAPFHIWGSGSDRERIGVPCKKH